MTLRSVWPRKNYELQVSQIFIENTEKLTENVICNINMTCMIFESRQRNYFILLRHTHQGSNLLKTEKKLHVSFSIYYINISHFYDIKWYDGSSNAQLFSLLISCSLCNEEFTYLWSRSLKIICFTIFCYTISCFKCLEHFTSHMLKLHIT
jgi:hypothetical protein